MTRRNDILTMVFCLLLAGLIFWDTSGYPAVQGQGFGQGPAFYPRFLSLILVVFGLFSLRSLFGSREKQDNAKQENAVAEERSTYRPFLPVIVLLLTVLFVIALPWIGFIPAGLLLVIVTALLIRKEMSLTALMRSVAVGIVIMLLVWLIFSVAIGVELPGAHIF